MTNAQELFQTSEEKEQKEWRELVQEGMSLWRCGAEEYRVLPYKYLFLKAEKKSRQMPVRGVSNVVLKEYPEIPLMKMFDEDSVRLYLEEMNLPALRHEIHNVEYALSNNYSYQTIKEWVAEASYCLTHQKPSKYCLAR